VWERLKKDGSLKPDYTSFDEMWKKLKTNGMWYQPVHKFKNWESVFKTPTGKFEFFSTQIELAVYEAAQKGSEEGTLKDMNVVVKGDEVFMPHYEDLRPSEARAYPLRMIPYEMINLASGWHPSPPFHKKTLYVNQLSQDHSFADINPKTADEYGLKQGDQVIVESPRGRLNVRANLFEGAMPGIVYLPVGFGHTAYDEFLRGKGVNPFDIVQAGKDPLSGQPVWWNTPVKLIKV
jgi:anaerobic selenocysteine-containing dehydrogenase